MTKFGNVKAACASISYGVSVFLYYFYMCPSVTSAINHKVAIRNLLYAKPTWCHILGVQLMCLMSFTQHSYRDLAPLGRQLLKRDRDVCYNFSFGFRKLVLPLFWSSQTYKCRLIFHMTSWLPECPSVQLYAYYCIICTLTCPKTWVRPGRLFNTRAQYAVDLLLCGVLGNSALSCNLDPWTYSLPSSDARTFIIVAQSICRQWVFSEGVIGSMWIVACRIGLATGKNAWRYLLPHPMLLFKLLLQPFLKSSQSRVYFSTPTKVCITPKEFLTKANILIRASSSGDCQLSALSHTSAGSLSDATYSGLFSRE